MEQICQWLSRVNGLNGLNCLDQCRVGVRRDVDASKVMEQSKTFSHLGNAPENRQWLRRFSACCIIQVDKVDQLEAILALHCDVKMGHIIVVKGWPSCMRAEQECFLLKSQQVLRNMHRCTISTYRRQGT